MEPQPGLFDGRYSMGELLGRGGMGEVYAAVDTQTGEPCALKLLTSRSDILRFKREFRAISRLRHPNCVEVHHFGQTADRWYFAMEYVKGGSVAQNRWESVPEVMGVALQVLGCLDHIHSKQIVHRDIKPQNILVASRGNGERLLIKVTDFGIARIGGMDEQLSVGAIVGSLPYLSPEQVEEAVADPRSDLYSLGIVLYQMLARRHPYGGSEVRGAAWLELHRHAQPVPLSSVAPHVPPAVAQIVMQLLEKDPARRFVTAATVYDAIVDWLRTASPEGLVEMPALSRSSYLAAPTLVGRDKEVAELDAFLAAVKAQQPSKPFVLEIEGAAGAGKSRLASQLFRLCDARDMRLILAACRPEPGAMFEPLAVLLDILGCGRVGPDDETSNPEGATRPETSPAMSDVVPTTSPNTKVDRPTTRPRQRSMERRQGELWELHRRAADQLLETASEEALVVVLEDAQWADAATLEFFSFLVRAVASARRTGTAAVVAFVITHRPVQASLLTDLTAVLDSERLLRRISIAPLNAADSARLVASMLMASPGPEVQEFTARLLKTTEGNPLLIAQSLHALLAAGRLHYDNGHWNLKVAALSDDWANIQDVIGERAARLASLTQQILTLASVIGRRFSLSIIQEALGLDQDAVLDYLDEAIRTGFIHEVGNSHEFVHDHFREAIYQRLSQDARTSLHRQVATILVRQAGNRVEVAADLAHHFEAGGDYRQAITHGLRAARFAMDSYAFSKAADLYEQAVQIAHQQNIQVEDRVLGALGEACLLAGRYDRATQTYRRLLQSGTRRRARIDLLRRLADVEFSRGDTRAAGALLEEAARQAGRPLATSQLGVWMALLWQLLVLVIYYLIPGLPVRRPRRPGNRMLMVRLCNRLAEAYYRWDLPRCLYTQTKATNMAMWLGPSKELALASAQQGIAVGSHGFYRAGFHYLKLARRIADQSAGPVERSWVALLWAMNHAYTGNAQAHDAEGRLSTELLKDSAEPLRLRQALTVWGEGAIALGRLVEAEALGKRVWQLAEDLNDDRGRGWALYLLGHVAFRRGDYQGAASQLQQAYELLFTRGHDLAYGFTAGTRLALIHLLEGRADDAVSLILKVAPEMAKRRLRHLSCPADGVLLLAAAAQLREKQAIDHELRRAVAKTRRRGGVATCLKYTLPLFNAGLASWALATGDEPRALAALESAVAAAERHGLVGELYDVHCVAAAFLPPSHPARARHASLAEQIRTSCVRPADEPSAPFEAEQVASGDHS
jgi:eukaryotic-like serine/threonine-protein kinase